MLVPLPPGGYPVKQLLPVETLSMPEPNLSAAEEEDKPTPVPAREAGSGNAGRRIQHPWQETLLSPPEAPVTAQETGTIYITGTFTSDSGEHAWSLAMYGTTVRQPITKTW